MKKRKDTRSLLISVTSLNLQAKKLGIDTRNHLVAFISGECSICKSAGFRSEARIHIENGGEPIIATLYVTSAPWLKPGEIGLSDRAWEKLKPKEGQSLVVTLAEALDSFASVRAKLHGKTLTEIEFNAIVRDMSQGKYSDIQMSAFVAASADLSPKETTYLTKAMTASGRVLKWSRFPIVDKHCVGGLPGNRTTMILVPIIAAFGLIIPKTSSRAITSPAGTADTMEVFAPVALTLDQMRAVVDREGGCIILGGAVDLSPVDDELVQIERALDLDSHSQLIASVLSKKMAAGSTHVLIDIPVGPTAKIRSKEEADTLETLFMAVAKEVGLALEVVQTDGTQPIGRGIGPTLEARDVLSVLKCEKGAPQDLRDRALFLAGKLLELCGGVPPGQGLVEAQRILEDGRALKKFQAICRAQGGYHEPILGAFKHEIFAPEGGPVLSIDNRRLARIAKLAGAPDSPKAGVDLNVSLNAIVHKGELLFTIYAASPGELSYALHYLHSHPDIILIG
ncbi:MAG: thymidine phosphorylase family protein [Alphaproteobacteria bacterium]|nr:thymidine phosphorylase family protein [Alphaproteobacteria bacterium]